MPLASSLHCLEFCLLLQFLDEWASAKFSSALLFSATNQVSFDLCEPVDQVLLLLIGGEGKVTINGRTTPLLDGIAISFAASWGGCQPRRANDTFCCKFFVELEETSTMVLALFPSNCSPPTLLAPEDMLYAAARYSLSEFTRYALIQQWLVLDAMLEHTILADLPFPPRCTLPHLSSRVEFRPSSESSTYEEKQPPSAGAGLLINDAIGAILSYYCRRAPEADRTSFLHELIAVAAAEDAEILAQCITLSDVGQLWGSSSFWVNIVSPLSVNNTPLGSPILGSFLFKKFSLRDDNRHKPSHTSTPPSISNIKSFLTYLVPDCINSQSPIDCHGEVKWFRNAASSSANSVRVAVPSFIADEITRTAKNQCAPSTSTDSWRLLSFRRCTCMGVTNARIPLRSHWGPTREFLCEATGAP
jgi:hypothetical protein